MPVTLKTGSEEFRKMARPEKKNSLRNFLVAFIVGGLICLLGQIIQGIVQSMGLDANTASMVVAIILITAGGLITGLGWYDELGQFAGAGAAVPITGFANAVVSAAMEYRQEGLILGTGARMYSIAGPVLTFGVVAAFLIGLIKTLI